MTAPPKAKTGSGPRIRKSMRELEKPENADELNAFLRAWQKITSLPPSNPNSFWSIASYHGEPFKPRKHHLDEDVKTWGGWCQHANVLFPTWHRFYVFRLEQALQTVCPDDNISMAYWDQTSTDSLSDGIPHTLTDDVVTIDGVEVPNPLKSFTLPRAIEAFQADKYYNKKQFYETVRYPYSGIQSPPSAYETAVEHNESMPGVLEGLNETPVGALNSNIVAWLQPGDDGQGVPNGVEWQYKQCLAAKTYNSFSNTDSAGHTGEIPLETPHNSIHLAVGGFDLGGSSEGQISGANGDMGENETAAFDPIFFFHHCNVDRVFWIWQKKSGKTDNFEIDPRDVWGTYGNDAEGQGLTPDQSKFQQLNMDTPLEPFRDEYGLPVTSRDGINIETQLGYTYSLGSLEDVSIPTVPVAFVRVRNIDKDKYPGSFLVRAFYKKDGREIFFGQYPVLSRWNKKDCDNCQHHLMVTALFALNKVPDDIENLKSTGSYVIRVVWREPLTGTVKKEDLVFKADPGKYDPAIDFIHV